MLLQKEYFPLNYINNPGVRDLVIDVKHHFHRNTNAAHVVIFKTEIEFEHLDWKLGFAEFLDEFMKG